MDENFIDEYFNILNKKLKNKRFTSELRKEIDDIDSEKLTYLIEKHFR